MENRESCALIEGHTAALFAEAMMLAIAEALIARAALTKLDVAAAFLRAESRCNALHKARKEDGEAFIDPSGYLDLLKSEWTRTLALTDEFRSLPGPVPADWLPGASAARPARRDARRRKRAPDRDDPNGRS